MWVIRLFPGAALLLLGATMTGQDIEWVNRSVEGIPYAFPRAYESIQSAQATGAAYNGGKYYLTVTSLPDTAGIDTTDPRLLEEYYKSTLTNVVSRLSGRIREARDTIVHELLGYYASVDVSHSEDRSTRYELLQLYKAGKLHGFSCQYDMSDADAVQVRNSFFASVGRDNPETSQISGRTARLLIAGAAILAILIVQAWIRRRRREP